MYIEQKKKKETLKQNKEKIKELKNEIKAIRLNASQQINELQAQIIALSK